MYGESDFEISVSRNKLGKYTLLWFKKETFITNGMKMLVNSSKKYVKLFSSGYYFPSYISPIINFKKKKIKLLTNKLQESYENPKICYICKKNPGNEYVEGKKYCS